MLHKIIKVCETVFIEGGNQPLRRNKMYRIHWMHWASESFSSQRFATFAEATIYAEKLAKRQPKRYSFYEVLSPEVMRIAGIAQ